MKNKQIEKMLLEESKNIDISMSENLKNEPIPPKNNKLNNTTITYNFIKTKKFKYIMAFASIFCALVIVALSIIFIPQNNTTSAYLTSYILSINPKISITTNSDDEVVNICSLNNDADQILGNSTFDNIIGLKLEDCVLKIINTAKDNNIFEGYTDTIKLYAINDNNNTLQDKLNKCENMLRRDMKNIGFENIEIETHQMQMKDFKNQMGFNQEFNRLDDMKDFLEHHDKYFDPNFIPGELPPPPPVD